MKKAENLIKKSRKWQLIASFTLLFAIILPFLTFASHRPQLFVDAKAKTSGNGSAAKPYKTISEAITNASKNTDVHVLPGTYKENIKLTKGISIYGSNKNSVIISAKNSDDPTVIMKDGTKIDKVTIKNGEIGVRVDGDSKASIIDCVITDNDEDGIKIKDSGTENSHKVSISKSTIKNNGRAGIYSEKRRVVLMDSVIRNNDKDGVVFAKGVSAWVEDNDILSNGRSGMVVTVDSSNVWTKNNTFRNNHREGMEVNNFGANGRIDVNKSEFINNEGFGIQRIARSNSAANTWKGFTQENNEFEGNKSQPISQVFTIVK